MRLAVLCCALMASAVAQEAPTPSFSSMRLVYDMSGSELVITRDNNGTVQLDGLPVPGLVLYVPATKVVYYQHPSLLGWLAIAPQHIAAQTTRPNIAMGAAWQPYLNSPTRRFEVVAGAQTCDNWFGSGKAASIAGLNVADLTHIIAALQYLNAGAAADVCEMLTVPLRMAHTIGLPLRLNGPNGVWELTELYAAEIPTIPLPTNPQPPDDDTRLTILLSQFSTEERTEFVKNYGGLPLTGQLEQLENMLLGSYSP
jgi:hypothetical protein